MFVILHFTFYVVFYIIINSGGSDMVVLMDSVLATTLVIIGVLLLGVLIFLLYYFVISRNGYKKQLKELERKYTYLDALLIGQDSQYIHRLEIISRTNLLYVDKYNEFSRRFKTIFESDDKFANQMIKQIKTLIQNKQYKNIKVVISDTKKAIAVFEENVNNLDRDLYSIIRPEEESRHMILKLKENYRRVKQIFFANSNDLELVTTSFTQVFDKLDQCFAKFETHIEGGEYDEANALIPVIRNVVNALDKALEELPNLCILVTSIIPEKISDLTTEYKEVEKKDIPLFNLSFKTRVNVWNNKLKEIRENLVNLKISGVKEVLENIQNEIEEMKASLFNEVNDKDDFDKRCDELYQKAVEIEKVYVKICSVLLQIRNIYVISNEHEQEIKRLDESINKLGNTKRILDNYIHSATKQPFSLLKLKLDELHHDYDVANANIHAFKAYLDSLKTSSEEAHTLIFVYYYRCKQIESILREISIPEFANRYEAQVESVYNLLNEIDRTLNVKPIDVEHVNELVEQLKNNANNFFDEIENKYREQQLAESAIVYGNRDRHHQSDAHQRYLQLETLFFDGDFAKVYHEANDLYRRMHVEENSDGDKK